MVQRQPGVNTVEVVDRIQELLPTFRDQMPPAVNLDVVFDRSESIRESVDDVKFTLVLTVVLVILVIFLFLRNVSATVIPSLALPLSIIGTFAAMYLLGYTLDNLSLMALDALGGVRGGRRDRGAREHRPPHGDGRDAPAGGVRGRPRDRLHDSFDDAVADGRLHPRAVHGRHHGPAVPRVRGGDHAWRF